jgi:hypothetical protein
MNAPPESEIMDDSSGNSVLFVIRNGELGSGSTPEQDDVVHSRMYRLLVSISALAVPLVIVTFLLFPAVLVVLTLVAICIVPAIVILCLGIVLYLCAPATSSSFAGLWGATGGENQTARRWDMDWTLADYIEAAAGGGVQEPRSRENFEAMLILKTVVKDFSDDGDSGDDDKEKEEPKQTREDDQTQDLEESKQGEEEKSARDDEQFTNENSDSLHVQLPDDNRIACAEDVDGDEHDIETGKLPSDSKNASSTYLTIRLSEIEQTCCDICMMDYELGDVVSQSNNSNCDHIFHKDCILDWMQKKHSCPCCRRNYLGEEDYDSNPVIPIGRWTENL